MKISDMLDAPCTQIVLFLHDRGEVRYLKLVEFLPSRGTLSLNLKHLEEEELIQRRIVTTKPIQSLYSLTKKGMNIARKLAEIRGVLQA